MAKWIYQTQIENRTATSYGEPEETEGFFKLEEPLARFDDNQSQYGSDVVRLYLISQNGEFKILVEEIWSPATGYSAAGIQENILTLDKALKRYSRPEFLVSLFSSSPSPLPEEVGEPGEEEELLD